MRKDVKFAITIGAILIVTVGVYLSVLLRGGGSDTSQNQVAKAPDQKITPDVTPAPTPAPDVTPVAQNNTTATESVVPPITTPDPTTQPTASTGDTWTHALQDGITPLAAPQTTVNQTVTPTIGSGEIHNYGVIQDNPPVTIDSASTQPSTAVAQVPVNTTSGAPQARTHRIASGESLWSIAAAIYGNGKYADKILAANPGVKASQLKVGTILVLPDITTITAATAAPAPVVQEASIDPSTSYKVASGDTLQRIAIKLYGDRNMADKIYDLNKTLIGADENRLKIGWVLKLPEAPHGSAAPAADAIH